MDPPSEINAPRECGIWTIGGSGEDVYIISFTCSEDGFGDIGF